MTKEVKYIVKNKRFKATWFHPIGYVLLIFPLFGLILGADFILEFSIREIAIGVAILVGSIIIGLVIFQSTRLENVFVEIWTGKNQVDNFNGVNEIMKVWKSGDQVFHPFKMGVFMAREIDRDYWNFTFNTTLFYHGFKQRSYLTVVCLDNAILINERHDFVGLIPRYGIREINEKIGVKSASR